MDLFINWFFKLLIMGIYEVVKFTTNAFLGLVLIVFKFQYQRFFTFVIIVILVWCDLCLIAPMCNTYGENFIHFLIILAPFIYLSETYKRGVV